MLGNLPSAFLQFLEIETASYILPAIPPLALLLAVPLANAIRTHTSEEYSDNDRSFAAMAVALGITWIVLGAVPLFWIGRLPQPIHDASGHAIHVAVIAAVAGGLAIAVLGLMRSRSFVVVALVLVVVLTEVAGTRILPALDPFLSARPHAELLRRDLHPDRIFTFDLPRSWDYGLAFYLGRELPEWSPTNPDAALVLTTPAGLGTNEKTRQVPRRFRRGIRRNSFRPRIPRPTPAITTTAIAIGSNYHQP